MMIDYSKYKDGSDLNWYQSDPTMQHYAHRYLGPLLEWGEERLLQLGAYAAGPMNTRAAYTDRDGQPKLIRYDRSGREINQVWYNEGYLATVADGYETGVVGLRYREDLPYRIPFFYTQLMHILMSQAESGFTCPVTLTMSAAFVLERFGGATFLTEIQGGSDVGSTETRAVQNGDHYLITGEKWFASNCDAGVILALARVGDKPGTKGLGLFLVPQQLKNGQKNGITIRRLKDKLGVRAVASGEVELKEAVGYPIGDLQNGFKYMAEALNVSRMCTATGALAISRRSFLEAAVYTSKRSAFGHVITKYPMVRETLLDMIVDIEAAWALVAQMILTFDRCYTEEKNSDKEQTLLRLLLAMSKYRCSENGVLHAKNALELHGGNGYIEEYVTPRLLRDAQVNTVWEGTSNIMGLEILKTLAREAQRGKGKSSAILEEIQQTLESISLPALQDAVACLSKQVSEVTANAQVLLTADPTVQNAHARRFMDQLTHLYSAVHLLEEAQCAKESMDSERLVRIAEYYVNRTYRPELYGIQGNRIPSIDLFETAVCYKDCPTATLI